LQIIKSFIDELGIPAEESVIIAGDFNIPLDSDEYYAMLDLLNVGLPYTEGGATKTDGGLTWITSSTRRHIDSPSSHPVRPTMR
jgi:endonuclease/exonuclease/phosphatase family metal-dependent hydrolase